MPTTALSKGFFSLGSLLPVDRGLPWRTTSRTPLQLHPFAGVQLVWPPIVNDQISGKALLQRHRRWPWTNSQVLPSALPCWCTASDDGGGGDLAGPTSLSTGAPASGTRWRLEEGGTAVHSALNVVLVSPQIPGNAGSIARTCAAAGVNLHLVEPMAFQLDDAKLKRAGLDYWPYVCVAVHTSWAAFMEYYHQQASPKRLIGFSKKAHTLYTDVQYRPGDWLLFGSETQGFPAATVADIQADGAVVRIPMSERHVRSLNLSVSVGIGLFEGLRQLEAHDSAASPVTPIQVPIEQDDH